MPLHLALLGVGSPVASAFVPTDLGATLKIWGRADGTLWQDSARTTPVTANNDPVGAADDASGNANHCTQATSTKRLTYKTGIQNGLPGLLGDGTDDFLVTPSMAWFPSKRAARLPTR